MKGNDKAHQKRNQRAKAFKQTILEDARSDFRKCGKRMCKSNVVNRCDLDERAP